MMIAKPRRNVDTVGAKFINMVMDRLQTLEVLRLRIAVVSSQTITSPCI